MNKHVEPHPLECDNPTQTTEAPERIKLPGGYYMATKPLSRKLYWLFDPTGEYVARFYYADEAQVFAAAMQSPAPAGEVVALREALGTMKRVAGETYNKWDADEDSKVGKWLAAMAGNKGIRPDVDKALEALATAPVTPAAELSGRVMYQRGYEDARRDAAPADVEARIREMHQRKPGCEVCDTVFEGDKCPECGHLANREGK